MKKNDLMQIELTVTKALAPIIKLVDKHETAIEDEQTGLKGRVQRHGDRIASLEKFQVEIKTKMAMISTIAGSVGSAIVLYAKSLFTSK